MANSDKDIWKGVNLVRVGRFRGEYKKAKLDEHFRRNPKGERHLEGFKAYERSKTNQESRD